MNIETTYNTMVVMQFSQKEKSDTNIVKQLISLYKKETHKSKEEQLMTHC